MSVIDKITTVLVILITLAICVPWIYCVQTDRIPVWTYFIMLPLCWLEGTGMGYFRDWIKKRQGEQ